MAGQRSWRTAVCLSRRGQAHSAADVSPHAGTDTRASRGYRPWKRGLRFSTKARAPSSLSSLL
ncbi:Uncharacterised protein [Bordetella pertussis]|nr:Uncharacterised protein [Bordetella pertussis]